MSPREHLQATIVICVREKSRQRSAFANHRRDSSSSRRTATVDEARCSSATVTSEGHGRVPGASGIARHSTAKTAFQRGVRAAIASTVTGSPAVTRRRGASQSVAARRTSGSNWRKSGTPASPSADTRAELHAAIPPACVRRAGCGWQRDEWCGCYPTSGVDTPSLNPSRSLNWNMRAPHGRSAGSLSSVPPAALIRAAAASTSAAPATLICR